jgi:uncharacterized protein YqeY
MNFLDQLTADSRAARLLAMRTKSPADIKASEALLSLLGEIGTKRGRLPVDRPWTDLDTLGVAEGQMKSVLETASLCRAQNRLDDLVYAEAEAALLESYVTRYKPSQMDAAALEAFAQANRALGLGGIMAALKAQHAGRYDGKLAASVIKGVLAS